MDEAQKATLRKCRVKLVKDLTMNDMFDPIDACSLFTTNVLECIKAEKSRPDQVRLFLDYLPRRGPDAFEKFLYCLKESGHDFVFDYIQKEYHTNQTNTRQGNSQSIIPSSVYVSQETQVPHDVEMGENSAGDVNLGDNTMEVSTSAQSGVQESISNGTCSELNIPDASSQSSVAGSTSTGTCSSSVNSGASTLNRSGYSGNYAEEYKMETNPRGFLLIINNKEFSRDFGVRTGTDVDCDKLKKLFISLGFFVEVRQNLTALEIKANLQVLSQYEKLNTVDCLAVALLTHGNEDYLYGVDGRFINVNEAFESFTAEKCPALHHKPKLFIINACRGDAEDKGSLASGVYEPSGPVSTDINHSVQETGVSCRIPNMKDFLVAYSTIPGHVSWRHLNDGSFFIQGFVNVFEKFAQTTDVLNMLVKVNNEVSKNVNHQGVQIPAPQVMLTKTWYLNPIVRRS